jgi:hypothetical protein
MTTPLKRMFQGAQPQDAAMLPGNRFFVRRLAVEGEDLAGQVNLALEAVSPFPLEQMLIGFVTSTDGKQVLAYAAHRRRFTAEESFAGRPAKNSPPRSRSPNSPTPMKPAWRRKPPPVPASRPTPPSRPSKAPSPARSSKAPSC